MRAQVENSPAKFEFSICGPQKPNQSLGPLPTFASRTQHFQLISINPSKLRVRYFRFFLFTSSLFFFIFVRFFFLSLHKFNAALNSCLANDRAVIKGAPPIIKRECAFMGAAPLICNSGISSAIYL